MVPASRLGRQVTETVSALEAIHAEWALIGGLALAAYKIIRATQDVDLLVDIVRADDIDHEMHRLGYESLHRSEDGANYARGHERIDFLFASRPAARRLLASARVIPSILGTLRIVSLEGLVGFKLQAAFNNPARKQDLEDIRRLIVANRDDLDLEELRGYFRLFDREALLDEYLG